jgi:hypothetical protein
MKYIRESIGFTPKILKKFFCSKHVFYRFFFRLSRAAAAAAAVDKIFLHAYSLDHKT